MSDYETTDGKIGFHALSFTQSCQISASLSLTLFEEYTFVPALEMGAMLRLLVMQDYLKNCVIINHALRSIQFSIVTL